MNSFIWCLSLLSSYDATMNKVWGDTTQGDQCLEWPSVSDTWAEETMRGMGGIWTPRGMFFQSQVVTISVLSGPKYEWTHDHAMVMHKCRIAMNPDSLSLLTGIYYDSSKVPEGDKSSVSLILDVQHSAKLRSVTQIFICQHHYIRVFITNSDLCKYSQCGWQPESWFRLRGLISERHSDTWIVVVPEVQGSQESLILSETNTK